MCLIVIPDLWSLASISSKLWMRETATLYISSVIQGSTGKVRSTWHIHTNTYKRNLNRKCQNIAYFMLPIHWFQEVGWFWAHPGRTLQWRMGLLLPQTRMLDSSDCGSEYQNTLQTLHSLWWLTSESPTECEVG